MAMQGEIRFIDNRRVFLYIFRTAKLSPVQFIFARREKCLVDFVDVYNKRNSRIEIKTMKNQSQSGPHTNWMIVHFVD